LKITELKDACELVERTIGSVQSHPGSEQPLIEYAERELESLSENVLKLSAFVRLNYTATVKVVYLPRLTLLE
jgi:hypothetical protein